MLIEKIGPYHFFVQGFRNTRVDDPEKLLNSLRGEVQGIDLQLLRADRVAGKEHLFFAARNAVDSFKTKDRRARHLSVEFLLFVSGEHQIIEAIKLLGITSSTRGVILAGLSKKKPDIDLLRKVARTIKGLPNDSVIEVQQGDKVARLRKAYRISDRELNSTRVPGESEEMVVKRLVIERSAMLALEN